MPETEGERFGRYEILEVLSRGTLGTVFRAFDPILRREVAIKVLSQARVAREEEIARFMREARAVAKLSHPNVVPVHEVGAHDGVPFFTMDYIKGRSLARAIREDGPIAPRRAVEICRDIARAISAAHQRGIIHRDLKPSNVMLSEDGRVLVTDFGLAKVAGEDTLKTRTGTAIGTPAYMPPEQARGDASAVGPHSDVYSLGAVLYECLTGRPPFEGKGMVDIVLQVMDYPPQSPRKLNPKVPGDLEAVVLKCLEKAPRHRYRDMSEMREDLERFIRGEAVKARPPGLVRRAGRFLHRNKGIFAGVFIGAAMVAGLVTAAAGLLRNRSVPGESALAFEAPFRADTPPDAKHWTTQAPLVDFRNGSFKVVLDAKEIITSELFYGNYRAELDFLAGDTPPAGFSIRGRQRVVFLAKHDGEHLILAGRLDLEKHSPRNPFAGTRPLAAVPAPPLRPGREYRLRLERHNLDLSLSLFSVRRSETGAETLTPLASLDYRGLQLTNWRLKNVNIGIIGVGAGASRGRLRVFLEMPASATADDRFFRGDYNGAAGAYKGMLQSDSLAPSLRAKCLLHLAFIAEIKGDLDDAAAYLLSIKSVPGPVPEDILRDAAIRTVIVAIKRGRLASIPLLLAGTLTGWLASPWRFETLPAAEKCLARNAPGPASTLLSAALEVFPAKVIDPFISAAAGKMLASEEYAPVIGLLKEHRFPSRRSLAASLLRRSAAEGLPIAASLAASVLAAESGPDPGNVVSTLSDAFASAAGSSPSTAQAILDAAGPLRARVIAESVSAAASSGKLGLLWKVLSFYPQAKFGRKESTRLAESAQRLLDDGHPDEVLRLFLGTRLPALRDTALKAAEAVIPSRPAEALDFLLRTASFSSTNRDLVRTAGKAALGLASRKPGNPLLAQWLCSPLAGRENAGKVLQAILSGFVSSRLPASLTAFLQALFAGRCSREILSLVPDSLYSALRTSTASGEWAEQAFKILSEKFADLPNAPPDARDTLADIYAVLNHPERAVVIWDDLAFTPGQVPKDIAAAASLKAGIYFAFSSKPVLGANYIALSEMPEKVPEWIRKAAGMHRSAKSIAESVHAFSNAKTLPAALRALGDFFAPMYNTLSVPERVPPDGASSPTTEPAKGETYGGSQAEDKGSPR